MLPVSIKTGGVLETWGFHWVKILQVTFPKQKKKKANHSREANKAYRDVEMGCKDTLRPLPDGTHQLVEDASSADLMRAHLPPSWSSQECH